MHFSLRPRPALLAACLLAPGLLTSTTRSQTAPPPLRCGTPDAPGIVPDGPGDCTAARTTPQPQYQPSFVWRVPVVVHVIRSTSGAGNVSATQVQNQIDILNEDFRAIAGSRGAPGVDTGIEFFLATTDPQGRPSTGITTSTNNTWFADRGSYWTSLAWDPNRYLNIYSNQAGGALGYVPNLPQSGSIVGRSNDRVVVKWDTVGRMGPIGPPFNLGRTTTHEVGHYLGLYHTFNGGCGGSNCYTSGDRICDTQPESGSRFGCPSSRSCSSPDPIHNYMDYTDDSCMWEFTAEQANRMRCTLEEWRPNLAMRSGAAFVSTRNAGDNPLSYSATRPVLGGTVTASVDVASSGHNTGGLFGFAAPLRTRFRGYVLLVDPSAAPGELLQLPFQSGPEAQFSLPIPSLSALSGMTIYTQAAHFGGAAGLVLSNAQDLTIGPQ
ncbi:MAG: zinc metalloprotease [Planctomycetota bacterium]